VRRCLRIADGFRVFETVDEAGFAGCEAVVVEAGVSCDRSELIADAGADAREMSTDCRPTMGYVGKAGQLRCDVGADRALRPCIVQ